MKTYVSARTCPECRGRGYVYQLDGNRVRALRQAHGLSLEQLAYESGVSTPYLSEIERGKRCSPSVTAAITRALNELEGAQ